MTLEPTLFYHYVGRQEREGVHMRFVRHAEARQAYVKIREILKGDDLKHTVERAGTEFFSGEFQFDLFFERGITRPEIANALYLRSCNTEVTCV